MIRTLIKRGWGRVKSMAEPLEPRPFSRKDTKNWCRGKVGVQHRTRWVEDKGYGGAGGCWVFRCVNCGRQFAWCWGGWSSGNLALRGCQCGRHIGIPRV